MQLQHCCNQLRLYPSIHFWICGADYDAIRSIPAVGHGIECRRIVPSISGGAATYGRLRLFPNAGCREGGSLRSSMPYPYICTRLCTVVYTFLPLSSVDVRLVRNIQPTYYDMGTTAPVPLYQSCRPRQLLSCRTWFISDDVLYTAVAVWRMAIGGGA